MVVNQQNMNRTELQCRKKKLPRRNHRRIDRPSCDFLFSEKLIFCVQHHAEKNLLILVAETFHVIIRNGSRIMKAETFSCSGRGHSFGKLTDALELDRFYFPDSADLQKFLSCTVIES